MKKQNSEIMRKYFVLMRNKAHEYIQANKIVNGNQNYMYQFLYNICDKIGDNTGIFKLLKEK